MRLRTSDEGDGAALRVAAVNQVRCHCHYCRLLYVAVVGSAVTIEAIKINVELPHVTTSLKTCKMLG